MTSSSHQDTIFAPATLIGAAGLTVFRLSGPQAWDMAVTLGADDLSANKASLKTLKDPNSGAMLDSALVLPFKAPHSFTGEDVVELHCHGGHAVANRMLKALSAFPGARLAEPGEFTRRGFENGKMDLTQAEAVGDLIHAETEAQAMLALDQLGGSLKDLYEGWGQSLKRAMAHIEADIDFADEDVPDELSDAMRPILQNMINDITHHLDDNNLGERLRSGFKVAVIGAPNAGKSSLINALSKRDVAIVTDIAGTTRDVLETHLNIGGFAVVVADTAGLRETDDIVESEGIKRARSWAQEADLKIALFDNEADLDSETQELIDENTLVYASKVDAGAVKISFKNKNIAPLSVKRPDTVQSLVEAITQFLKEKSGLNENVSRETLQEKPALITRQRHRTALLEAKNHLERALEAPEIDMMAEDVRLALRSLGKITGRVDVEDLLDVIFSEFCIGK